VNIMMPSPWSDSLEIVDQYTGWTPQNFSDKYYSKFQATPSYYAAGAFADAEILIAAIDSVQSFDPLLVANQIRKMYFPTIYGNITFDHNNQAIMDFLVVQVQQDLSLERVFREPADGVNLVYPMPTWNGKDCIVNTENCSNHGYCNEDGACICGAQYYSSSASTPSCDLYCEGELDMDTTGSTFCKTKTKFYIGGISPSGYAEENELIAMMKLGVSLVNNKTDGWFDNTTLQIEMVLRTVSGACSTDAGSNNTLTLLNDFYRYNESEMSGLVGSYCSSSRYRILPCSK
jgi:hypothetical protein